MSLREAQQRVDDWVSQFEEGYFPPLANVARLAEEVGELAREINHQFGPKKRKADEAAGLLFVVICIANSQRVDLDDAFAQMMAKVTSRDAGRWTRKAR